MMEIVTLTKSLGQKVGDDPERYRWTDEGDSHVTVELLARPCRQLDAVRPEQPTDGAGRARNRKIGSFSNTVSEEPFMGMEDRDGKIWMDGGLVDWRDARIHVLTHTLHYGCGAFEGVRAYNTAGGTAIFRLREHTERLFNSAKILRMKMPVSFEQVVEAQREVVRANSSELLHPPAHLDRLREAGRLPQGQHDPPDDRGLGVGRLPRRRGPQARHPRQDLAATPAITSTSR